MNRNISSLGAIVLSLCLFGAFIGAIYVWTGYTFARRVRKLQTTFLDRRPQLEELAQSWSHIQTTTTSCGEPAMSPGLVHFSVIGRAPDGTIRVGRDSISPDGFDLTVPSVLDAARKIDVGSEELLKQLQMMDSISVTEIYQHDAELHFIQDNDSSLSLMYVPSSCKQFANYPLWNRNSNANQQTPFARMNQLATS